MNKTQLFYDYLCAGVQVYLFTLDLVLHILHLLCDLSFTYTLTALQVSVFD